MIKPNHKADKKRHPAHMQNFGFALEGKQFKGRNRHGVVFIMMTTFEQLQQIICHDVSENEERLNCTMHLFRIGAICIRIRTILVLFSKNECIDCS
jgi:hypothetical protein